MFFQRYYLNCLAHASYLIADEETKIAAVVDPQRDVDQYIQDAEANGFTIKYVFLTHFHADFIAGHIELRDRVGAKIYLGAKADPEYDFTPLKEGDAVEFGRVRLSVLDTPGHTPESISILVYDLDKSDLQPHAVLTGDALFIGDVGRPDLLASIGYTADQLADMLYDSLHKLMQLPDETLVYPAHGAGSLCGKQLSDEPFSTIGDQKRYNYALQPMSLEEFKRIVTAEQPDAPDYFVHDAILNRKEREALPAQLQEALKALSVDEVLAQQTGGAQVLDTRESSEYAAAHLRNSFNISLDGKYATWCGTVLDKSKPIVVIADSGREEESIMRLGRIGFDQVAGYLGGGAEALQQRPEVMATTQRITAQALAEQLDGSDAPVVVDVRTFKEWSGQRIDGSVNLPLNQLDDRTSELSKDQPLVVHCRSGYRSSVAASLLEQHGFSKVLDLVGGMDAWNASHLPTAGNAEGTSCSATSTNATCKSA